MENFGYLASLGMGVVLGLMGGGGSILTVPILVYLFSIPPSIATGYSLFVVGSTALIGSIMYIKRCDVDFKAGLLFAIPSVIGVNISRGMIISRIPKIIFELGEFSLTKELLIMVTFSVLMLAASLSMIRKKSEQKTMDSTSIKKNVMIALQGFLVGVIAGFVGAGGGFLIIPALVFMAGLSMRVAVGTSLMIIAFQSLLGFLGDVSRGAIIDWKLLLSVVFFAILGILSGSLLSQKVKEHKLKIAFGWFVLIMGTSILLEQLRHLKS